MSILPYIMSLPKTRHAATFNGEYLEDLFPGYVTVRVEEREPYQLNFDELDLAGRDGTIRRRSKVEPKEFKIIYAVTADTYSGVHQSLNQIKAFLLKKEFKITFNDEMVNGPVTDTYRGVTTYYKGVVASFTASPVNSGGSDYAASYGEITVKCFDPYKYSISPIKAMNYTTSIDPNNQNKEIRTITTGGYVTMTNLGAAPVPINVKVTVNGSPGYVGLALGDRTYQLGTPDTVDQSADTTKVSQRLFYTTMWTDPNGFAGAKWVTDENYTGDHRAGVMGYYKGGASKNGDNPGWGYATADPKTQSAVPSNHSYGSGAKWHGPIITRYLEKDAAGTYPINWTLEWCMDFNTDGADNPKSNIGKQSMTVVDEQGHIMCRIQNQVDSTTSETAHMVVYSSTSTSSKNVLFDIYDVKRQLGEANHAGNFKIEKMEDVIKFTYPTAYDKSKTVSFTLKNGGIGAAKISWSPMAWGTYTPMFNNFLRYVIFTRHYESSSEMIPNHFQQNDVITINGENGEVRVNDVVDWNNVDIGSQTLMLEPGTHTLAVAVSSYASDPEIEVEYTEKWV